MTSRQPKLTIEPADCLIDQSVSIYLEHAPPCSTVSCRSETVDASSRAWCAQTSRSTDESGAVTLASGDTIDEMALFWSASLPPGARADHFVWPGSEPLETMITCSSEDGEILCSEILIRRFRKPTVKRRVIECDGIRGVYFAPVDEGKHPAIISLGGSDGGLREHQAALLASHGYVSLALAYFLYPDLPNELADIPVEYFFSAINWLERQPEVDQSRIGIVGQSRGGEAALLVASLDSRVRAVVGYVPAGVVFSAVTADPSIVRPAWTLNGKALPYLVPGELPPDSSNPIHLAPVYVRALDNRERARAAEISVEKICGDVLLFSGQDDKLWPSSVLSSIAARRLLFSGFSGNICHVVFPEAGHLIRTPYMPTSLTRILHPVTGLEYDLGGTPRGCAQAAVDAWDLLLDFLRQSIGPDS